MKTSKNIYLLTAAMTFIIVSCSSNQDKKANDDCNGSYELIGRDTVNVIDCHGKQGKWVPTLGNKLQDTTYYKNDAIIQK